MSRTLSRPKRRRSTLVVLLLAGGLLTGCQSIQNNVSRQEATWQALHVIDVAQTLNAASDDCYAEDAWLTQRLIGKQPSDTQVLAWGVGTALAHWAISRTLEARDAPQWLQRMWSYGTISHTGYAVVTNHNNGVRPWGDNRTHSRCFR